MSDWPAGTGGGLRYQSEEPTLDMVNQALPFSCLVACARQLLRDAGLAISEGRLIEQIGVMDGLGSTAPATAAALSDLHPRLRYAGGSIDPDETLPAVFRRDPWVALLGTDRGSVHSVIVDRLDGLIVWVRDSWGLGGPGPGPGSRASISLPDFLEHLRRSYHTVVVPIGLK